jgi:hypothetical protein
MARKRELCPVGGAGEIALVHREGKSLVGVRGTERAVAQKSELRPVRRGVIYHAHTNHAHTKSASLTGRARVAEPLEAHLQGLWEDLRAVELSAAGLTIHLRVHRRAALDGNGTHAEKGHLR